jgi:hypothetical protein
MFEHLLPDPGAGKTRSAAPGPTDCGDDPIRALKDRLSYYQVERRWKQEVFWDRRQNAQGTRLAGR